MLTLNLSTSDSLHTAYMPFIKNGGLFIPTSQQYNLGDSITLSLLLPDDTQQYIVLGTVIWLTPENAQIGTPAGIGIQFDNNEQNQIVNQNIDHKLSGYDLYKKTTNTL